MDTKKNTIVLGITGSIAAYKGAELCSQLAKAGYEVHVIMTAAAQKLVCPQTFFTLSRNPVVTDLWTVPDWRPGHVDLADRASLLVIAPCTADMIGKLANGIADDALSTFGITFDGKTILAPAMNPKMWANPAVRDNVAKLQQRGVLLVGPEPGHVACDTGDQRPGRMSDPAVILRAVASA